MSVQRRIAQLFAHLAGDAFRILPRRKRFAVASRIAMMIAPWLRRSSYYDRRPSLLDGPREESLRMMLRCMTRARVEFDPTVIVHGREHLQDGALIVVSGHFLLNVTLSRVLYDAGRLLTMVLGMPREPIYYFGTTKPISFRYSAPQLFLQLRTFLAREEVVFITVEQTIRQDAEWIEVETSEGMRYVSPAAFAFAAKTGIPLVFSATHVDEQGRIHLTIEKPLSREPAEMAAEFCDFLKKRVAAIDR